MIHNLTVTNYLGRSIKMDLRHPEKLGLAITGITGLGPGKATINHTEISTDDGGVYNSARLGVRNIVLNLLFLDTFTIETARELTYEYFPIKKEITLTFQTDSKLAQIRGFVETNEPSHFGKNVATQISVLCPFPYFYDAKATGISTTSFSNITPLFEFPFSNESTTEPLIEFANITNITEKNIVYKGNAEVGVLMTMQIHGNVKNVTIHNITTGKRMAIETDRLKALVGSAGFKSGDRVMINTIRGEKFIHLIRDNETTSIAACLSKSTDWIEFVKGDNHFAYTAESGISNIDFTVQNLSYYQGI